MVRPRTGVMTRLSCLNKFGIVIVEEREAISLDLLANNSYVYALHLVGDTILRACILLCCKYMFKWKAAQ